VGLKKGTQRSDHPPRAVTIVGWRGASHFTGATLRGGAIRYRSDIDGLRALAVLSVIAYHAAPTAVHGGFVGVDVFFVISGFLITTIIVNARSDGTFSLIDFYARRIRRLFPALIVVLLATFAIGWFYLLPNEFSALGKHLTAGAAYFINVALKREAGYFDASADHKPLLHLWSLSVEEQFYLVWPLLILLARTPRQLLVLFALVTVGSFASGLHALGKNPASAFFLPQNRVWQLSAGGLLALAVMHVDEIEQRVRALAGAAMPSRGALANIASCLGLALILCAVTLFDDKLLYPGWWGVVPTLGAMLVILAGTGAYLNRALLSSPPMVGIGLISYALYLWHWPLLSYRNILGLQNDWPVTAVCLAITLLLAFATYRFIERPIRLAPRSSYAPALLATSMVLAGVGLATRYEFVAPHNDGMRVRQYAFAAEDWGFPSNLAAHYHGNERFRTRLGVGSGDKVLFIGDSNMEQYWPRLERIWKSLPERPSVEFATRGGCAPIPGFTFGARPHCIGFAETSAKIAKDPNVKTVVVAAAWISYLTPEAASMERRNAAFAELEEMLRDFTRNGKTVWLVLNIPSGMMLSPLSYVRRSFSGEISVVPQQIDRTKFDAILGPINDRLRQVAGNAGANVIDPMPSLCNDATCNGELADGTMVYRDGTHLRAGFVREHGDFIDRVLGVETSSVGK